jgi:hypothetical protein
MKHWPYIIFLFIAFIATSCTTSFDEIKYSDGVADFSRTVAVGGSHFAGYADRAWYLEAQTHSIPAILAERFSFAGGGNFIQPLVNAGVGIGVTGNSKYVLQWIPDPCATGNVVFPMPVAPSGDLSNYNWIGNQARFNNVSVPNTRTTDVSKQSYGLAVVGNPLYARFASNPGSSTITGDALLVNPTFFMVWLGMEDVFFYARTGGDLGTDSITNAAVFEQSYNNLMSELTSQQARGVVVNIPPLQAFPFFTEIAYNGLQLNAQQANELNLLYATVDTSIKFFEGINRYVIADPATPSGRRHINQGEYILLSTPIDSINCKDWGTKLPIPQRYVLDAQEVTKIKNAILAFNSSITIAASTYNLALVDMNSFLLKLNDGIHFNGVQYSSEFITGNVYSTDGFHFTPRGSALAANEIIRVINTFFNAKIPRADVNSFDGLVIP